MPVPINDLWQASSSLATATQRPPLAASHLKTRSCAVQTLPPKADGCHASAPPALRSALCSFAHFGVGADSISPPRPTPTLD
eukprot:CAMPEP_0118857884 /NCGR_PEP_ID=MMETSP1163-20130328/4790_1 /TAXON_ID=124430 /ORGANISM="Phaeomonas parva, Strain CCMP2877" /LENGTH=81 /DNA_ID=CAMNT_0006791261 /DNA_START=550 /DNA_END=795 /DNA_ORIENTATION=-